MRPVPGTGVDGRFQSTRLREARRQRAGNDPHRVEFQSTRLREARLSLYNKCPGPRPVSIHAPA